MSNEGVVKVFCTGGTFNKIYDHISEKMSFDGYTVVPSILEKVENSDVNCSMIFQKDSLDFSELDLQMMYEQISEATENKIVLVHGTSRLVETAIYLSERLVDKSIVVTGAMRPYAYCKTEASFNLGYAIAAAALVVPGVWVAMHGTLFEPHRVTKDHAAGRFRLI